VRKEARLFSTSSNDANTVSSTKGEPTENSTNELNPSRKIKLEETLYIYKTAIEKGNLKEAFKNLKAQSAPGIDGETKASFSKTLDNSITKLNKDLRKHNYKPSPIRVVHILKPNGGKGPLGISSVRDKIVQATFKKEVEKIYDLTQLWPMSERAKEADCLNGISVTDIPGEVYLTGKLWPEIHRIRLHEF